LRYLDLAALGLLDARGASWPVLECLLRLVKDELNPIVDLAGLEAELIGEVGDRLLAGEVATDDLSLLFSSEAAATLVHGTCLRLSPY
jgi:hypothetical protein